MRLKYSIAAADLFHRSFALHQRRKKPDVQTRESPRQDMNHVRDGGAARRCDDADAPREARQRTFALDGEQPFHRELLLELLEGKLQRAEALRLDQIDQQLIFASRFVNIDSSAGKYGQPILRLELPVAVRGAESDALHLRFALLEREVVVAALRQLQSGDLARNPDVLKFGIEHEADSGVQLADAEDAPLRREIEFERELLHA